MIWIKWGGRVLGRAFFDGTAGYLLGRYLRRINPMYVVAGFVALPIGALVVSRAVRESWGVADACKRIADAGGGGAENS